MSLDIPLILSSWFLMFLWQLVGFPLVYYLFRKRTVDAAWAFGRVCTWLLISTLIWFLAHLGLPINRPIGVLTLFLVLSIHAIWFYRTNWFELKKWGKKVWPLVLSQELVFLVFFIFLSVVRGFNPDINGLEKFMDAGLIQSYLRSPTLPTEDMWLAGMPVNYYTFGHFLGAIITQFWGISIDFSYNLLLGFLMGLIASEAFSLAVNLGVLVPSKIQQKIKKFKVSSLIKIGLIGTFLVVLAGNGQHIWYGIKNQGYKGYWYPDATRFIERTIHEFPAYSFIVSDLHAHVWDLPIVLFLLINIRSWLAAIKPIKLNKKSWRSWWKLEFVQRSLLIGFLFGLMMSTSAWDVMIYGLFLGIVGLVLLSFQLEVFLSLALSALVVLLGAFFGASPWFFNFESISEGIRVATEHSPIWQLLVLWGPHVFLSLIALFLALRHLKQHQKKYDSDYLLVVSLVVLSLLLILLPELIFMKDIYPNHPRANTMFKLTFQAFILMGLVITWLVSWLHQKSKIKTELKLGLKLLTAVFLGSVLIYPFFGYRDFYNRLKNYKGLDGLSWLRKEEPADYDAIMWLRQNTFDRPVILEAVGESYTTFARVSTFTGLPTVLGWRVHEWLWRGGFDIPGQRTTEVTEMFSHPDSDKSQQLFREYQVEYVFVGSKEREAYESIDETRLRQLGRVVFEQDGTFIVKLD